MCIRDRISRALKSGVERVIIADPGRPTFYELADLCSKKHDVSLQEWFAVQPNHFTGEVLEIRARPEAQKEGKKEGKKDTKKAKKSAKPRASKKPTKKAG